MTADPWALISRNWRARIGTTAATEVSSAVEEATDPAETLVGTAAEAFAAAIAGMVAAVVDSLQVIAAVALARETELRPVRYPAIPALHRSHDRCDGRAARCVE